MKVISLINHKGGVGKTTLCTNLAHALKIIDDPRALKMVDADPQGSLRDWYDVGKCDFGEVIIADKGKVLRDLTKLSSDVAYLLIDTPGKMGETLGEALAMSDMVIIPLQPSPYDVWATQDTIDLVKAAMSANPRLRAMFLLNQAIPNSAVNSDVLNALKEYAPKIKTFEQAIGRRVAFNKSARDGETIYKTKDKQGMFEINQVTHQMIGLLFNE